MLTRELLTTLKQYTETLSHNVTFVVQTGDHPKRAELLSFLTDFAAVSDKLSITERDHALQSAVSFSIEANHQNTGIRFSGIPAGHEFNSLVLAVLQAGGSTIKLDTSLQTLIARAQEPLHFEAFISLSCHNCPDVVQALNQFALLNPNITSEMIDGALFPALIKQRDIQGVPSVYLNGEPFATGKVNAAELIEKLLARYPELAAASNDQPLPLQDVTVIGGGPAGVAAAIYSARKGLKVSLIADRIGGQVKDTIDIENLIGTPKTTGPELSNALLAHLQDYDITLKEHLKVTEIKYGDIKQVTLSSDEIIHTKTLIVATGARWRELGIPGEREYVGKGVAYCPHCDGPFFKNKDVAVIGGGNSGIEAALDLSAIAKSVTVFEFMAELKADKVLVDKATAKANIRIHRNAAAQEITAQNGKVAGLRYLDRATNQAYELALDGVFVQIGLVPNSGFLGDGVARTAAGEVQINERCQTSATGVFACGDVTTVPYKQIVIAMGEGAKASLSAFEYLLKESDNLDAAFAQTSPRAPEKLAS
ncbi:alkyl hydroperoxide reductase subunit F [Simiduia sp. 21SJ11W-1]|uniref:alkyl hydroperoxide reductase subunit F n=1 Tax=Simiduia sp. 21SJ11W-1 TaxID=2909669 RepID=UPI0020A0F55B|nr:alkyl hydroperoxide reductase subunit F [Simiduia sp. 21SJ11W-1]UTA47064.1 alkyl hydroperoxide reductase subunit F [Simiduia sp. 21SJ11W-1]